MVPVIAAFLHAYRTARVSDDQNTPVRHLFKRSIDIAFQRNPLAAAQSFVCGDHPVARTILDPARDRVGAEAAENHRMDRPDPRTCQHGKSAFGHHGHIDGYPVAFGNAHLFQGVGHSHNLCLKFGKGNPAHLSIGSIGLENQCDALAIARLDMPVDGIVTDVENTVLEPLDGNRIEGPVANDLGLAEPIDPLHLPAPESIRILDASRIE